MINTEAADLWTQYRPERGLREREERDQAARLLTGYLQAVGEALRNEGLGVSGVRMSSSRDLEAHLTLTPIDPTQRHIPRGIELAWAEDTGWSISHRLLGTPATPWRYLHLELVPAPSVVARFVALTLDNAGDVGMLYPAQFRFRGQSLRPVIDALARQSSLVANGTRERLRQGAPS